MVVQTSMPGGSTKTNADAGAGQARILGDKTSEDPPPCRRARILGDITCGELLHTFEASEGEKLELREAMGANETGKVGSQNRQPVCYPEVEDKKPMVPTGVENAATDRRSTRQTHTEEYQHRMKENQSGNVPGGER